VPSKKLLSALLLAALLLPAGVLVVGAFARLLTALGDVSGGRFFERLAQFGGVVWVLTLLGLLLAMAAQTVRSPPANADEPDQEEP
jgi:hypothetical protein